MDEAKLKIAQAACKAYTNDALARQLQLIFDRGQSPEWRKAVADEAATRIFNPGKYFTRKGNTRTVYECPACPGSETKPGTCTTMGCGRTLIPREVGVKRPAQKAKTRK